MGCTRASACGLTCAFSYKFATQAELGQIADRKVIELVRPVRATASSAVPEVRVGVPEQPAVRAAGDEDDLHAAAHLPSAALFRVAKAFDATAISA